MALKMFAASAVAVLAFVQVEAARKLSQFGCDDDGCMETFEKCGGSYFNSSTACCDPANSCVVKNYFYAQCIPEAKAAINIANGWDGTVLECEEMPEDVIGGPMDLPENRRLLDSDGGYGGPDCEGDTCELQFEKCGGGFNMSQPCCDPELSCVVKNWFYAQCLTEERAALNVVNEGWDGRVLMCEEMPDDAAKGPAFWEFNKTAADVEYVVSRKLHEAMDCEDDTCVDTFEKCGGTDFNSSVSCCDPESECVVKNYWYAQCLNPEDAAENIDMHGWDGRVLSCEEMPEDLMPEDADMPMPSDSRRRLSQYGDYGSYGSYGSYGNYGGMPMYGDAPMPAAYGEAPMPAAYGSRDFTYAEVPAPAPMKIEAVKPTRDIPADMPATAPVTAETQIIESDLVLGNGCEECAPIFGQCADKGDIVSCCGEGLQCTKKHEFYGQCLPKARAARNVESFGWNGAVLQCGNVML